MVNASKHLKMGFEQWSLYLIYIVFTCVRTYKFSVVTNNRWPGTKDVSADLADHGSWWCLGFRTALRFDVGILPNFSFHTTSYIPTWWRCSSRDLRWIQPQMCSYCIYILIWECPEIGGSRNFIFWLNIEFECFGIPLNSDIRKLQCPSIFPSPQKTNIANSLTSRWRRWHGGWDTFTVWRPNDIGVTPIPCQLPGWIMADLMDLQHGLPPHGVGKMLMEKTATKGQTSCVPPRNSIPHQSGVYKILGLARYYIVFSRKSHV